MTTNKQDLLAIAYTELAFALIAHRPSASPVRIVFDDGENGRVRDLPDGIILLVETVNDPDEVVLPPLRAALRASVDESFSCEQAVALRELLRDTSAIPASQARGTRIYVDEYGAISAGIPGAFVYLSEGRWTREGVFWRTLGEALAATPATPPPPAPIVFFRRGEGTLPAGRLLTEMLLIHTDDELRNPATPEILRPLSLGMTPEQMQALVALFARKDQESDYGSAAQLYLRLVINTTGTVEAVLEDIVPQRVFRAHGTARNGGLHWVVYDEAQPSGTVECESLRELLDGLFAIAINERQDRSNG